MPIFHVLGLLSDMGDRYWVLPERKAGGHKLSGFASRDDRGVVRVLLYSHHAEDTQSRSEASFDVTLDLDGGWLQRPARVEEYRFDQDHNSPFKLARSLRDRPAAIRSRRPRPTGRDRALARRMRSRRPAQGPCDRAQARHRGPAGGLAGDLETRRARAGSRGATHWQTPRSRRCLRRRPTPRAEVEQIQKLCECHSTSAVVQPTRARATSKLTTRVAGNGCVFLKIEPETGQ